MKPTQHQSNTGSNGNSGGSPTGRNPGLNPQQQKAARTIDGPMLVLAGAGSGKTRVITEKIAYLIGECGISPSRIAALTFTNKSAQEMKTRVKKLAGSKATRGLRVSTFHRLALNLSLIHI